MANTEIDSLSLDIKITGLKKEDVTNIDKLSRAVARLSKSLKEADFSKLSEIKVPKGIKNIQIITQNFRDAMGGTSTNATSNIKQEAEETATAIEEQAQAVEDGSLVIEKASKKYATFFQRIINWFKSFRKVRNEDNGKDKTKDSLEKLLKVLKRFKTIAFIKVVRAILNAIVQAIKTGVSNLALFDKSFNETMSNMKTSVTNITNSLALILRPFIEVLQPFIQSASQTISEIANGVSRLQASIKGLSTYTKINAKYMEDFSKSSQKASLFSFDTFNTLDLQDSSGMFETANVDEQKESNDELETSANLLKNLQKLLSNVLNIVKTIFSEVLTLIDYLMPTLNEIFTIINNILEPILPFIQDILNALNPLTNLLLNSILSPLLKILNTILKPIYELLGVILPIITDIVSLIVDILSPVLEVFEPLLTMINELLSPIMEIVKFIVDVVGGLIGSLMNVAKDILTPIIDGLKLVFGFIGDISKILGDIFSLDFIGFFTDFETMFKRLVFGLLKLSASIIDGVVNMIIDAINIIFVPINKLSEWFNWGWQLGIPHINLASLVPSFANGGIVGELWQMNEYGNPEMLYNANGSNNTSVINQAQLSLAFEQAIYNTGLLDAIAKAGIINIDGRAIAQSATFKNEINRTNPGLNIR